MPTQRPRLTLTETDDVARILDDAADRWPDDREHRGRLLKRLVQRGAAAVRDDRAAEQTAWAAVIDDAAGAAGPAAYAPGYLDELRHDWLQ